MGTQLRIADVFCGMGSFNVAAEKLDMRCVYACDIDPVVQKVYMAQFGIMPESDIRRIDYARVPDHDILCIGFPCVNTPKNSSSTASASNTNEYLVARTFEIVKKKKPQAFIIETARGLLTSNSGNDLKLLEKSIKDMGYEMHAQLLKCEDFGIPQTRHRLFIVGLPKVNSRGFQFPKPLAKPCPTLGEYLEEDIVKPLSNTIRSTGRGVGVDNPKNWSSYKLKSGDIFEYTLDHALKMQGFPEDFDWANVPEAQRWKLVGNTIPTCLSLAILGAVKTHLLNPPMTMDSFVSTPEKRERNQVMEEAPPAKKQCSITIKSGTSICITLPPGTNEQSYILQIIS